MSIPFNVTITDDTQWLLAKTNIGSLHSDESLYVNEHVDYLTGKSTVQITYKGRELGIITDNDPKKQMKMLGLNVKYPLNVCVGKLTVYGGKLALAELSEEFVPTEIEER